MNRSLPLALLALGGVALTPAPAESTRIVNSAIHVPSAPPATTLSLTNAFPGLRFEEPTCLASPPSDLKRLFVCQKRGLLRVITDVTASAPEALTFLDLRAAIKHNSECGLLGVAFHPRFSSNGFVYVYYSTGVGGNQQRVSRFTVRTLSSNT